MIEQVFRRRGQLFLAEKRPSKRLFFSGPVATPTGLCFARPFDDELLTIDRRAQRVLWRVVTRPDLRDFRIAGTVGGLILGNAVPGIAAFNERTGDLVWTRPELGGVFLRGNALLSRDRGRALVEIDIATSEVLRSLPIDDERVLGLTVTEVLLCPDHHADFEVHRDRETARPYRCMSLDDGRVLWERNLAQQAGEAAGEAPDFVPYVVPGSLGDRWIGAWRTSTFACSRRDGTILWFARGVECGPRVEARDGLVMGMSTGAGRFHVLDERTGGVLWTYDGRDLGGAAYPRPAAFLGDYAVYGMESGHLAVFDPRDGRLVWSTLHKAPISDVRVIDGLVYVTTGKGELLIYEPTVPVPGLSFL